MWSSAHFPVLFWVILRRGRLTLRKRFDPFAIYIILQLCSMLLFWMVFTVNSIYYITVVELTPLQLVLVGTTLEFTVFVCEVPTGVLADVKSRRLSVIVGYVLIGVGFVLEGSAPYFGAILLAQVIWGLGFTFTSGATQAWIVDEVGEERAAAALVRGGQAEQVGTLLAIPLSVLLGRVDVTLPIVTGGVLMVALAGFLALTMREEGFTPASAQGRSTGGMMLKTVQDARGLVRRQPLLLALLGIGWFFGLYSEGLDRLWMAHLLEDFVVPLAVEPVVWLGVLQMVAALLSLVVTEAARRRLDANRSTVLGWALMANAGLIVLALAAFGLTGYFWLAVSLYLAINVLRNVRSPFYSAWFNLRIDDPQVRATMFSVDSQVDAIGQITGGPLVGAIGNRSIRAALVTSALILLPALPLHRLVVRRDPRAAGVVKAEGESE